MKEYRVYIYYDLRASVVIKADNEKDAESKILSELDMYGIEKLELKVNKRMFDAMDAEEIE